MKLIVVVIDGMGDTPAEELGGKTPLEVAETPNMDQLARNGASGLMYTVKKGIAPESDVAVMSILGYDPFKYHTGRGPLEALGSGITIRDGDLALRCNFATIGPDNQIVDRRVNISPEEGMRLSQTVNEQVKLKQHPADFELRNTVIYRCVLVIKSRAGPLSGQISNTDLQYVRVKGLGVAVSNADLVLKECKPLEASDAARNAARLVNEFVRESHRVLDRHPINEERVKKGKPSANVILTRDAGSVLPRLPKMSERFHHSFACLAEMPVEKGIAMAAGMSLVDLPAPGGDIKVDYKTRAEKVLEKIKSYDCVYVHIKGPDVPSHSGDAQGKVDSITNIDRSFLGNLLPKIDLGSRLICVTADHTTPWRLRGHTDDPVPLVLAGPRVPADGLDKFCERTCCKGSLGILTRGTRLMPMLIKHIARAS